MTPKTPRGGCTLIGLTMVVAIIATWASPALANASASLLDANTAPEAESGRWLAQSLYWCWVGLLVGVLAWRFWHWRRDRQALQRIRRLREY